ncbi:MAG: DNA repair protein RadC [Lachnospiraceae bacterium]|nr:DNA repair protein RadC [Lachnospiraceae bacterium]
MNEFEKRTMKDLPESERPYEKCRDFGPEVLSDAELLAVILRTGCPGKTAYDLAVDLLRRQRGEKRLTGLTNMTVKELCEVPGIGWVKAVQLTCLAEICKRLARERSLQQVRLSSSRSVADYFMQDMKNLETEEIRAAFFDTKGNLIREVLMSKGTVNASVLTPREVFLAALSHHAVYVILVHNHPSGDPAPSAEDVRLTRTVFESGELIGIPLMDHIVIGDGTYISFKEQGLLT